MPKLSSHVMILEHKLSELRLLLERQAGILLECATEFLSGQVAAYMEARQLASVADLLGLLRSSDTECENLLERLLDGETGFFRHPAALDALQKQVVPELEARKSSSTPRQLRLWSAGCSTGEEPYSIAVALCEALNRSGGWNIHIVATDIRRQALEIAERGLYPQDVLEHVPRSLIQPYFSKVGPHFLVKPRLRNLVTFTSMNLARPAYIGRFDGIFCMDVLPHFSMGQRIALAERLHLYLEPGGYLFLGQGEKLPAAHLNFQTHTHANFTLYRKPLAVAAKSGR